MRLRSKPCARTTTIGELFALGRKADAGEMPPEARQALREREAAPVLEALEALLAGWRDRYSESGKMGMACKYVENQAEALRVFLRNGRVPIHNDACEVSIRTPTWRTCCCGSEVSVV